MSEKKKIFLGLVIFAGWIVLAVFIGEKVIPGLGDKFISYIKGNPQAKEIAAQVMQRKETLGKNVKDEYENYVAAMRSVGALSGSREKIMTFEEFKRNWERRGENDIDRWIQENDLAKVFKKIKKRDFYCWCQAKGYISLAEFHNYMGWQSNWNPDKLAKYVPEYIKNPIPEKGKRIKYYRCLQGKDEFRTR